MIHRLCDSVKDRHKCKHFFNILIQLTCTVSYLKLFKPLFMSKCVQIIYSLNVLNAKAKNLAVFYLNAFVIFSNKFSINNTYGIIVSRIFTKNKLELNRKPIFLCFCPTFLILKIYKTFIIIGK